MADCIRLLVGEQ
uniref:Uncharacterized protein n=1 Tax=Anguilla anguilla TaxID=7936 RepID=A0A0E9Q4L6_ANGAN